MCCQERIHSCVSPWDFLLEIRLFFVKRKISNKSRAWYNAHNLRFHRQWGDALFIRKLFNLQLSRDATELSHRLRSINILEVMIGETSRDRKEAVRKEERYSTCKSLARNYVLGEDYSLLILIWIINTLLFFHASFQALCISNLS